MRRKTLKAVVTFASASDAMAVEAAAREARIPGRMIPIPSEISAGCGLAWCVPAEERDALLMTEREDDGEEADAEGT